MSSLAFSPNNPIFMTVAVLCTWIAIGFPFGLLTRHLARADAFSGVEAYLIGQVMGPFGLLLIRRENRRAAERAYEKALEIDHASRAADDGPEVIDRQQQLTEGIPTAAERPGGLAFKPPPTRVIKQQGPAEVDKWNP